MPSNQWSKQNQQLSSAFGGYLNGGNGDSVVGGVITGAPSAVNATQGIQDDPGDKLQLGTADALALSKTSIGTLYGGLYAYEVFYLSSVLASQVGVAAFQRTATRTYEHTVTTDESGATGIALELGVFINVITKGYAGYIQCFGKATVLFTTPLTGVAAAGCGVYVAGDGVGRYDIQAGNGANPTFAQVDTLNLSYRGIAETAPAANTLSVVDRPLGMIRM